MVMMMRSSGTGASSKPTAAAAPTTEGNSPSAYWPCLQHIYMSLPSLPLPPCLQILCVWLCLLGSLGKILELFSQMLRHPSSFWASVTKLQPPFLLPPSELQKMSANPASQSMALEKEGLSTGQSSHARMIIRLSTGVERVGHLPGYMHVWFLSSQHPHGYCGESRCWAGI